MHRSAIYTSLEKSVGCYYGCNRKRWSRKHRRTAAAAVPVAEKRAAGCSDGC
ncbi:hypothetical protein Hanom_Chr00s007841g01739131 [Helianthus anomalus]